MNIFKVDDIVYSPIFNKIYVIHCIRGNEVFLSKALDLRKAADSKIEFYSKDLLSKYFQKVGEL